MRIACPHTSIHPLTQRALDAHAPTVELHPLTSSPSAYWELLASLWADGDGVLIIEHDIEIHERVVPDAESCPQPWCVWPYEGPNWAEPGDQMLYASLGCTRFSTALLAAEADLMTAVGEVSQGLPARDWRRLDVTIAPCLLDRGYEPHAHLPAVLHHHQYPTGCACGRVHEES